MAAKAEEYAGVAALPEDSQVETVAASVDVVNAVERLEAQAVEKRVAEDRP